MESMRLPTSGSRESPLAAPAPVPSLVPVLVLALALPLFLGAASAQGESLGVSPAEVRIENAQGGQSYERTVTVQNELSTATVFTLELRGDNEPWTTTDPIERLEVPARTNAQITVTFGVPEDAYTGTHAGFLTITADPREQPEGSGLAMAWGVTVLLNVIVGGEAEEQLTWSTPEAPDVEIGTPPMGFLTATNTGNIVSTATARAEVLAFDTDDVLAEAQAEAVVIPGRTERLEFTFEQTLPEGQYRMRFTAGAPSPYEAIEPFKVVPPGALGKEGVLRYIEHEPWVRAGDPVKLTAAFDNTGTATIARAAFTAEIYLDDRLVGVVEGDSRVIHAGDSTGLSAFYTPEEAGRHTIVGRVNYDGFETLPSESVLNVQSDGGSTAGSWLPWLLFALVAAGAGGWFNWTRTRTRKRQRHGSR